MMLSMTGRRLTLLAGLMAALMWLGLAPVAKAQQGTLRERIRERMAERREGRDTRKTEPATDAALASPGTHQGRIEVMGVERLFMIHVPPGYRTDQPMPMLLAFHGGGGSMALQADNSRYGLISKADSAGFIAVFPNGHSGTPGHHLATWNAGGCCGSARDSGSEDVAFVRALIEHLKQRLSIDARRIYATGMSNGAMMSHRLACELSEQLAGIAAVAGTDATSRCQPRRPIPVLMIHALDDDHVLYQGGAGPEAFRDRSKVMDFVSVPETTQRWVQRNHCSGTPLKVLQQPGAWCERYSGCAEGVQVQLCTTETGGHSWPGGRSRPGKGQPSQALDANDTMWAFFQSQSLSQPRR
ncbi:poly(3-hydroxybutyrate) depolymerase [Mitsuaria sp. WAJ17]|uniref:extracellular catalytic domain type 1 short-chain-length polyhydroxyalkanoate depolymerase n=1 Tax=Mitsuaria sp. WAJ17 TaxID=2761452 RepID=UPI001603E40E|nr:PHB depolymerase family esterase [Mitsuaria sp. WAJ17]MBB2485910.1 poly(3-hydroxybutyrate) depolymerase [Mitsuaria sp. WAJ17]